MDVPAICKFFGWDPKKICGPTLFSDARFPEGNCCYGHAAGCALHTFKPTVNGKPFVLSDHRAKLQEQGLTKRPKELVAMIQKGGKPQGAPRQIGNTLIYPVQHFA